MLRPDPGILEIGAQKFGYQSFLYKPLASVVKSDVLSRCLMIAILELVA